MVKHLFPRSLFARSLIILITPVVLIQMVTTFVFFDNHWSKMTARLSYAIAGEVALITDTLESNASEIHKKNTLQWANTHLHLNATFADDKTINETTETLNISRLWEYAIAKKLRKELRKSLQKPFTLIVDTRDKQVQVDVQLDTGMLRVRFPGRRLFSSSGYIVILWMLGTSLLLLMVAIIFMRNQIRPIRKLAIAAERFGKGGEVATFKPTGAREVRRASKAFLDMNTRIRRQIEQRTTMLAGVSHDLRTPLTRLKLQIELLKQNDDTAAMKSDIKDMERMIDGYLDFARGADGEQSSFTNLSILIQKTITPSEDIEIKTNIEDDIYLMLKPIAMERCLNNLINNAKQYGSKINIVLEKIEDTITITIEDNGPGVPPNQYAEVFKPFYRTDKSRHAEHGHVGLGLSIAQDIIHTHGGEITLDKSELGGLKLKIELPA